MHCNYSDCDKQATFHFSWIQNRRCAKEQHFCEPHAKEVFSEPFPRFEFSLPRRPRVDARQFEISLIIVSEVNDQQVVYLHEVDGDRRIPLLIGIFEAMSLQRRLKGETYPRPLTHDVTASAIRLLGGGIQDVTVHKLEGHIYFAEARIERRGEMLRLDARPSDAFILASLFDCPIYYAEEVLRSIPQG